MADESSTPAVRSVQIPKLTAERLREVLNYDPQTGIFTYRIDTKWHDAGEIAGGLRAVGYVSIGIDGKGYLAHRLAWLYVYGVWPQYIDHIDMCRDHNWISNLRDCSNGQNMSNRPKQKNSSTGLKGVYPHQRGGNFFARIQADGKNIYLGTFPSADAAHAAYVKAAKELHGEFARTG